MTIDNSSPTKGTNLPGQNAQTMFSHSASAWRVEGRCRRAENLLEQWRRMQLAAEHEWLELLADRIRRHPAYLHPAYASLPAQALLWGMDTKRGPIWDSADVRLMTKDGVELCTFDLDDSPKVTMALAALSELQPPLYEEDELHMLL
ncbi:hypothetical protein [Streptomyces lydicus]|uniref:hypothetical protein n=1 Tax=Streptomyces lydicus TaxID=47763 RepID=UPI0013E93761|nr:hypothetical protein [Streptomyces lydicus]MCZ1012005.1 hypothetical protein [Streptomyces lydicus]